MAICGAIKKAVPIAKKWVKIINGLKIRLVVEANPPTYKLPVVVAEPSQVDVAYKVEIR